MTPDTFGDRKLWVILLTGAFLAWLALQLCGCSAPLTQPNYPSTEEQRCNRLDDQHRAWGAIAKFSGVLASSGALVAIPTDDHKDVRWAAGISAAALGAVAAASVFVAEDAAATWARECREAERN